MTFEFSARRAVHPQISLHALSRSLAMRRVTKSAIPWKQIISFYINANLRLTLMPMATEQDRRCSSDKSHTSILFVQRCDLCLGKVAPSLRSVIPTEVAEQVYADAVRKV